MLIVPGLSGICIFDAGNWECGERQLDHNDEEAEYSFEQGFERWIV
jgi:hypothetical protein